MRDLPDGWGHIMLSHSGLVKVLWVEVNMKGTIRLMGYVWDDTHLVG